MKGKVEGVIVFDGSCTMCHTAVQFLLKRDKDQFYKFTSSQSDVGKQLKEKYKIPEDIDSLIVIESDRAFIYSDAVLQIIPKLPWPWQFGRLLRFIPPVIRHRLYRLVAKNRHRFFKKSENCRLPTREERQRFLE